MQGIRVQQGLKVSGFSSVCLQQASSSNNSRSNYITDCMHAEACMPAAVAAAAAAVYPLRLLLLLLHVYMQVGVFDTAFHQTMPDTAFMYGLPYDWYTKHAIRRYGFHGTR
jgi:acetate kinase